MLFLSFLASLSTANVDHTHRQLIDAIRQRDTKALIEAVENGLVMFIVLIK